MRDARVLDRGRNGEENGPVDGLTGEGRENTGWDGERAEEVSDAAEWLREVMGTVRLLILLAELRGESGERGRIVSSGGISSAAGIGRPLAAAISWYSVQFSLKSSKPRQNGAIRRSI